MDVNPPANDAHMDAGEKESGETHPGLPSQEEVPFVPPLLALSAQERSNLIAARAVKLSKVFDSCKTVGTNCYSYHAQPPTLSDLNRALPSLGLPDKIYQAPFYSRDVDIPDHSKEYAGLTYRLKGGQGIATLDEWSTNGTQQAASNATLSLDSTGVGGWEYASDPPSVKEIRKTIEKCTNRSNKGKKDKQRSQVM